jgi:hypothetical protein
VKITIYPADSSGCGAFRLIWVAEELKRQGHDIDLRPPEKRDIRLRISGNRRRDKDSHCEEVLDLDTDVVVLQRITHQFMAEAIPLMRKNGIAVVTDVDDDLTSIHPSNPAYKGYHPRNQWLVDRKSGEFSRNSWHNLVAACRESTLVTVSTPALLDVYARQGQGKVIFNHLPSFYYGVDHVDSDRIGWPASLASHPDDPSAIGGAMARLCADPGAFQVIGDPTGCGYAFGLARDPSGHDLPIALTEWPRAVAGLGIGVAPLADTRFNRCKSWLKPLEMSALGVPWVASPRAEYSRLYQRGVKSGLVIGALADTPRRWYQELKKLQDSPALRQERAAAAREVADGFRLEPNAWRWLECWHHAYDLERRRDRAPVVIA